MKKKPNYPLWLQLCVMFIAVAYLLAVMFSFTVLTPWSVYELALTGSLNGAYIALTIGMLSALFILRDKEALYVIVLVSCMTLFFEFLLGWHLWLLVDILVMAYLVLLVAHVAVLWHMSYLCFDAVVGGGNYHEHHEASKKKTKKKKK